MVKLRGIGDLLDPTFSTVPFCQVHQTSTVLDPGLPKQTPQYPRVEEAESVQYSSDLRHPPYSPGV